MSDILEDFSNSLNRLKDIENRYQFLSAELSKPDITENQTLFKKYSKDMSDIEDLALTYKDFCSKVTQYNDSIEMISAETDPELKEMAKEEANSLKETIEEMKKDLKVKLIPPDPLAGRNIIVEIRAGTGGEEAALFATELYRMYTKYAESKNWKTEIIDFNETELGGFKEVTFNISGKNVYENLRFESGAHRVQRIPATEANGRVHTSAVTVAVLPEMEETDIEIRSEDLRIDTLRASGAGGQHVNKTESAVRITHIPTGLAVKCQDQRSQLQNRAQAMKVLVARLYEKQQNDINSERADLRKGQVGSGDRSEKIRTYNFPQNRVTDHRINMTLYKLETFMMGDIDEIIQALKINYREELLKGE